MISETEGAGSDACMQRLLPIIERGDIDTISDCHKEIEDYLLGTTSGRDIAARLILQALGQVETRSKGSADCLTLMRSYVEAQIDPAEPSPAEP